MADEKTVGRRQQFLYSRQISNLTTLKKMSFLAITNSCKWTWKWWHEMPFCYCKSIILACFRFLIKKRTTKSRVIYKSWLLSVEKNAHPLRWQKSHEASCGWLLQNTWDYPAAVDTFHFFKFVGVPICVTSMQRFAETNIPTTQKLAILTLSHQKVCCRSLLLI